MKADVIYQDLSLFMSHFDQFEEDIFEELDAIIGNLTHFYTSLSNQLDALNRTIGDVRDGVHDVKALVMAGSPASTAGNVANVVTDLSAIHSEITEIRRLLQGVR